MTLPDVALHIVQRGNNRQPCFFRPSDYRSYLRYLKVYAQRFGCSVHAYCLMTNHVHLLLTPRRADSCARLMKHLGQCYVQTVNMGVERTGTLWEGRFRSCLVPSERYALACYRYIELNPVRAGLVSRPEDYPWSSYLANAGWEQDPLIVPHPAFTALASMASRRHAAYRELFDMPLPQNVVEEIRGATRSGRRLGEPRKPRGRPPAGRSPLEEQSETGSVPI